LPERLPGGGNEVKQTRVATAKLQWKKYNGHIAAVVLMAIKLLVEYQHKGMAN
jgi:hypothetical protein